MMLHPKITEGLEALHTRWPQSFCIPGPHGGHLVVVPSVRLPAIYQETITTVLFEVPPGFPGACLSGFFTDIPVHFAEPYAHGWDTQPRATWDPTLDYYDETQRGRNGLERLWPEWRFAMRWCLWLQRWNPNTDGLYCYMSTILRRLQVPPEVKAPPELP